MATVQDAIASMRLNKTPIWWLFNGEKKVSHYTDSDNIDASVSYLESIVDYLAKGSFTLKATDKESNRSGANHFTFTVGSASAQPMQTTTVQPSSNPYGISDLVYQQIQAEARQRIMTEQMHAFFMEFSKEWPGYKAKIDKMHEYLLDKDDDGNGISDFLESTKKASEIVKTGIEAKKMLSGDIFG